MEIKGKRAVGPVPVHPDVAAVVAVMARLGLDCSDVVAEDQNAEYGAALALVDGGLVRFRVGKVTPTKVGLFVAAWRRAPDGGTEPFTGDGASMMVVAVREEGRFGAFAFPSDALVRHGIVSVGGRGGKRGFRVYPPWSATTSAQAQRTQHWQGDFFVNLSDAQEPNGNRARRLLSVQRCTTSARAWVAACCPAMPCAPGPGGAAAEHR